MDRVESELVVLAARPYRETSRLLDVLSADEGRLSLVARGANRPGRGGLAALAPMCHCRATFRIRPGADIGNLDSVEWTRDWPGLRGNMGRYAWGCLLLELAAKELPSRQGGGVVFGLVLDGLAQIADLDQALDWRMLARLFGGVLAAAGHGLGLDRCQECGAIAGLRFLRLVGMGGAPAGAICERCALPGGDYLPLADRSAMDSGGAVSLAAMALPRLIEARTGIVLSSGALIDSAPV